MSVIDHFEISVAYCSCPATKQNGIVNIIEPPHDKTNKMTVRPAKTLISLGIRCPLGESLAP